jgi:hypothetical protein
MAGRVFEGHVTVSGPVTIQTASLSRPDSPDLVTNEGWSDPTLGLLLGAGAVAGALLIWARRQRPRLSRDLEPKPVVRVPREPATDTVSEELVAAIEGVFQRQVMDGERRLGDRHWQSGAGRNVGYDVLEATAAARRAVQPLLAVCRTRRQLLLRADDALDALIARWRERPGDDDGYGIATLHEIRRDLAAL